MVQCQRLYIIQTKASVGWSYKISRLKSALFGQEWNMSSAFKLHVEDSIFGTAYHYLWKNNIPSGGRKLNYSIYCRRIEERYFQMSPLISVMRTNASITLFATYCFIPNPHCKWGLRKIPILPPLLNCVGVALFSTGISEECHRLAAVACEKVKRVRDGGRCRPPLPTWRKFGPITQKGQKKRRAAR
jgi:hypothetical protein